MGQNKLSIKTLKMKIRFIKHSNNPKTSNLSDKHNNELFLQSLNFGVSSICCEAQHLAKNKQNDNIIIKKGLQIDQKPLISRDAVKYKFRT